VRAAAGEHRIIVEMEGIGARSRLEPEDGSTKYVKNDGTQHAGLPAGRHLLAV
jgi:hypothetical protein